MSLDFSNVKSVIIPEGEVKEIRNSGGTPIWKGSWLYTINIGDYVSSVRWSDDNSTWTTISSNTTVEIDSGKTLYIQALSYNVDDVYWDYTQYNFNVTRTEVDEGGSVTIYQTRARHYYTTTISAGNYVSTVKAKVNSGDWATPASSVSVTHLYEDTVYWSAVDYNTSDAQWTYSGTLSGDFTNSQGQSITISQTRTLNSYTITWKNYDGSILETDYNVYYGSGPTYDGSTPTKPADNTYTYSFSGWYPTIDVVTGDATYTAQFNQTYIEYIITWKWQDSYGVWTTATNSYHYNDTPSRAVPHDVTDGDRKQVCTGWDSLANVTANRTITATYQQQYYVTINSTRCSADVSSGWRNSGTTITWTANSNCAFDSTGATTTQTATITGAGTYNKSADYIYVTIGGTNCSANYSTGWHPYNRTVTWTASSAYAFDTSNTSTATDTLTSPGGNYSKNASYVKRYTLTINVTGSYGTYGVSRTSSPYQRASTGALSGGATIYYGDVLSGSSSNGTQYGSWDCSEADLALPTGSWNGGETTSPSITLTAKNSATANLYRRPSWSSDWTHLSSNWGTSATTSLTDTGLAFNTTYYYHVARYKNRNYWIWSASPSNYTGTNGVTSNVSANFTFTQGSAQTESQWIGGGETPISTGSQASYTVTWRWQNSYQNWTTENQTYNYGATPSRTLPSTVTSGTSRNVPTTWDDLSAIYSNRTINCNYQRQYYVTMNGTNCSSDKSTGWYDSGTTITWTVTMTGWYAFDKNGSSTITTNVTYGGTYSVTASYYKLNLPASNCSLDKGSGWYTGTTSVTATADTYYLFNGSTTSTKTFTGPGGYTFSPSIIGSSNFYYGSSSYSSDHQTYTDSYRVGRITYYIRGFYFTNSTPYSVAATLSFSPASSTKNYTFSANSSSACELSSTGSYPIINSVAIQIYDSSRTTLLNSWTIYFGSSC